MELAGGDEGVDARARSTLQRLGRSASDVAVVGARASEQMVLSRTASAIALTASKSPFEEAAKPASITSTLQPLELTRNA